MVAKKNGASKKKRRRKLKPPVHGVADPRTLTPHPRNYRKHSDEQLKHICASVNEFGVYRNVVIGRGDVILAGHGVVQACVMMNLKQIPVVRIDVDKDDPRALKLLAGDNEIGRLGEVMDRELTSILKDIYDDDETALLGTGFDDQQLAALVFVTRDAGEIADMNEAAEWVGMPNYDFGDESAHKLPILEITFKTRELREKFVSEKGIQIRSTREGRKWATVWPYEEKVDLKSVKFDDRKGDVGTNEF